MFRYLVFAYSDYYPRGGMEDCILKTNNFEEINPFIEDYIQNHDLDFDEMHYYDCEEDKTYEAEFELYNSLESINKKKRFTNWSIVEWQ